MKHLGYDEQRKSCSSRSRFGGLRMSLPLNVSYITVDRSARTAWNPSKVTYLPCFTNVAPENQWLEDDFLWVFRHELLVFECIGYALALMTLSFPSCGRLVRLVMMTFGRVRLLFSTLESPIFGGRGVALFQPKTPKFLQDVSKANPVKNGLEKSLNISWLGYSIKTRGLSQPVVPPDDP